MVVFGKIVSKEPVIEPCTKNVVKAGLHVNQNKPYFINVDYYSAIIVWDLLVERLGVIYLC